MANYVIYNYKGSDLKLKISAESTVELEERLGDSIFKKLAEVDKLKIAVEFLAAAVPAETYEQRRATAIGIFDDMIENGKKYRDYVELINSVVVASGFIEGETVERQVKLQKAQDELEKAAYTAQMKLIEAKTAEIAPADTTA
jgi:hypothetical protein